MAEKIRPYSFRYVNRITETLAPWRNKLGDEFNQVVNLLEQRDIDMETHINLTIGQGYLDAARYAGANFSLGFGTEFTGLTLNVNVPANRLFRLSGHIPFVCDNQPTAVAEYAFMTLIRTNNGSGFNVGDRISPPMNLNEQADIDFVMFDAPPPGLNVYTIEVSNDNCSTLVSATNPAFHAAEDVGPNFVF